MKIGGKIVAYEKMKCYNKKTLSAASGTAVFVSATSQSPCLHEILATAYNPGMCPLALPVISSVAKQKSDGKLQHTYFLNALLTYVHNEVYLS